MESLTKLKRLLDDDYKIEKIQPLVFASDAEVNIVTVTLLCPDGKKETIRAYREESRALREYITPRIEEHHIKYKDPAKHKSELLKFAKVTHG
jgi:hypothetical protein